MSETRPYTTAERLNQIINERGIKQVDIIRATEPLSSQFCVKISKTDLSQYKSGKVEPGQDKLYLLAAALGVSEPWLMGYDVPADRNETTAVSPSTPTTHSYPYFDADIAAGSLTTVEGLESAEQIQISDTVMGKYAGDDDLFITNINGESMNRVIPNHSLVIIKRVDSFQDLYDGEIVIFSEDDESYSVKRFYNDKHMQIINFAPDSSDSRYRPINFHYEDMNDVKIIGRVVSALIEF